MSSKTHYFCDQCKKEVEREKLTDIELKLNPYSSYATKRFESIYRYYSICEECAVKLGFVIVKAKNAQCLATAEPTTAEKLYDLIAQMIQEQTP